MPRLVKPTTMLNTNTFVGLYGSEVHGGNGDPLVILTNHKYDSHAGNANAPSYGPAGDSYAITHEIEAFSTTLIPVSPFMDSGSAASLHTVFFDAVSMLNSVFGGRIIPNAVGTAFADSSVPAADSAGEHHIMTYTDTASGFSGWYASLYVEGPGTRGENGTSQTRELNVTYTLGGNLQANFELREVFNYGITGALFNGMLVSSLTESTTDGAAATVSDGGLWDAYNASLSTWDAHYGLSGVSTAASINSLLSEGNDTAISGAGGPLDVYFIANR